VAVVNLPAHDTDPTPPTSATMAGYVAAVSTAVHSLPTPVYLVGHSMAGMVISQFAENEPTTVAQLIYFAAFLPANGESLLALAQQDPNSLINQNLTVDGPNGVAKLPPSMMPTIMCADCSSSQGQALIDHYRDEPLGPLATTVTLTSANWGSRDKRYFFTTNDQAVTYPRQQAMAARVTLAKTASMSSSHCPHLSAAATFGDKLETLMK
jgi:pimeloyl-ACP methyl ester carboxylesterase